MKVLDHTFSTPEENLACDEALLDLCEDGHIEATLRLWEPTRYFVVLGYSNRIDREVNVENCERRGLPVLRRCSGGGAVLQGPGCLNYSLILGLMKPSPCENISKTNAHILAQHKKALQPLLKGLVRVQGTSDLTLNALKFSGNAQRRKRRALLFHGTFLLDADMHLMESVLRMPSRLPEYRENRPHSAFLTCVPLSREAIRSALCALWDARDPFGDPPHAVISELIRQRYGQQEWNHRF